jgi:hypothetical protein
MIVKEVAMLNLMHTLELISTCKSQTTMQGPQNTNFHQPISINKFKWTQMARTIGGGGFCTVGSASVTYNNSLTHVRVWLRWHKKVTKSINRIHRLHPWN